jgi:hypothetical protein
LSLAIPPWVIAFARTAVALTIVTMLSLLGLENFTKKYKFLIDLSVSLSTFVS